MRWPEFSSLVIKLSIELGAMIHISCYVGQFVTIQTFYVIFLHQRVDVLLDIWDLWRKSSLDLLNYLLDELDVLQLLPRLHDTNNCRLNID